MGRTSLLIRRMLSWRPAASSRPAARFGIDPDPVIDEIAHAACELAEAAAPLQPDAVLQDIARYVAGRLTACLHERTEKTTSEAQRRSEQALRSQARQSAANARAGSMRQKAQEILSAQSSERLRAREATEAIEVHRGEVGELPLLEKVNTHRTTMIVTMGGTAAGLGMLAHLSLEGSGGGTLTKALVPFAAVMGAIACELIIGTVSAAVYDRLGPTWRRRASLITLVAIILILVGTEVFAGLARQKSADRTNEVSVNRQTGQLVVGKGGFTPSLIWTAPLSVLITLSGAGVVGIRRVREARDDVHGALADAKERLADARNALVENESRVDRCREEAQACHAEALRLGGESRAAELAGNALSDRLQRLEKHHGALIDAIAAEAVLTYRIAAERAAAEGVGAPRRQVRRSRGHDRALPLVIGLSGFVGALTADVTSSLFAGLTIAPVVMILASLLRRQSP